MEEVKQCKQTTERVIVFCRTYYSCAKIHMFMKSRLGKEFTQPVGAPDMARFRLVDKFSACTHPQVKADILKAFCTPNSQLMIVIATVTFGMGLGCPNVRRVIHWGPSGDIELYLQETGRTGRDTLPAQAILCHGGEGLVVRNVEECMKEYCANKDVYRREVLLKRFDSPFVCESNVGLFLCCDV